MNSSSYSPPLKNIILDHIAIAVHSLEESVRIYEALGLEFSEEREVVQDQGVTTAFAQIDQHAHIELLEPFGDNGPIHQYLQKKGPGLHHLCFKTTDIQLSMKEGKEKGLIFLYPEPKIGAKNCLVNFIHPKSTGGVLIELSQSISDE